MSNRVLVERMAHLKEKGRGLMVLCSRLPSYIQSKQFRPIELILKIERTKYYTINESHPFDL